MKTISFQKGEVRNCLLSVQL